VEQSTNTGPFWSLPSPRARCARKVARDGVEKALHFKGAAHRPLHCKGLIDATMQELISRKVAAERLGVTRQRIEQLIREGRLTEGSGGLPWPQVRKEYEARVDASRRVSGGLAKRREEVRAAGSAAQTRVKRRYGVRGPVKAAVSAETETPAPAAHTMAPQPQPDLPHLIDFSEARARREHANAQIAELNWREQAGHLVKRDVVAAKEFEVARRLRDRILGLPARLAGLVAADAMATIVAECEQLIRELQDDAAKIAEG
jgi:hypothetical protein